MLAGSGMETLRQQPTLGSTVR